MGLRDLVTSLLFARSSGAESSEPRLSARNESNSRHRSENCVRERAVGSLSKRQDHYFPKWGTSTHLERWTRKAEQSWRPLLRKTSIAPNLHTYLWKDASISLENSQGREHLRCAA